MFEESGIPKSFFASIFMMSSGPFSPCMTKRSPPNDMWTHFLSFRGRLQSNGQALEFEFQDFKSSAKSRHGLERTSGRSLTSQNGAIGELSVDFGQYELFVFWCMTTRFLGDRFAIRSEISE
ncbi:hypothetical protein CSKR_109703 [Clonorchis sinensis]|uniref:Uncharacterized protein n=1 Tax=Clonorchis sinensis TaxID=79923 RepID=A0A419PF84_CLOSI|nr:hypothetical protein CSKR_109703 [Clonorchis sinensis]